MSLSYLQSESSNLEGVQGFPKIPNMCSGITFTPNTHLLAMRGQWLCLQMVMWVRKASRLVGGRLNPWDLGRESSRRPGLQQQKERQGRDTRHSAVFIGGRHVPGSLLSSGATGKNPMVASPSRPFWNEMGYRSINELRSVDRPI